MQGRARRSDAPALDEVQGEPDERHQEQRPEQQIDLPGDVALHQPDRGQPEEIAGREKRGDQGRGRGEERSLRRVRGGALRAAAPVQTSVVSASTTSTQPTVWLRQRARASARSAGAISASTRTCPSLDGMTKA